MRFGLGGHSAATRFVAILIATLLAFAGEAGRVSAQPTPSSAACIKATRAAYQGPTPIAAATIAKLLACYKPSVAQAMIQDAIDRAVRAAAATAPVQTLTVPAPRTISATEPIAYLLNGRYYSPDEYRAMQHFALESASPEHLEGTAILPDAALASLKQQTKALDDTITANAIAAAAASATTPAPPPSHCPFYAPSQSAANGGVALAAAGAIYTRTWLGILSLLVPVIFAQCPQPAAAPAPVPVIHIAGSVNGTTPITGTVTETGYSGPFTVAPVVSGLATTSAVDASGSFTLTAVAGQSGSVTLKAVDSNGRSGVAQVTVTP